MPGHDPVEALAIEVDDHRHVAEVAEAVLEDRLPDVALVELGVADEGHEPALRLARDRLAEMEPQVAIGQRREHRGDRTEADRAGREVDRVGVLGPRRVRLQPAELAQPGEHRGVEVAEQVLERVVGRRGMRLDGDEVAGPQPAEVERGQDRDDRGARGLVATDLDPVVARPDVVGLVDHPDGQPQDPGGDGVERGGVGDARACRLAGRGALGAPRR